MRILKRNLAFMLAMIMALSLTAFAGYEDYPDVDELTYVEAVDVLTELGIVEGSNGKLLPTGNLTRAQAAKLIAYTMLGKKAADALQADVATFVDVPTYHWAAGYVEYCANEGIVGGNGDGTFAPEANVTASQFAKMLLCAVGYGEKGEFTGANWDDAVNSLATKLGVFDENLDVVFANAVTREEAFLYTFNALTKVMEVTYSADADEYYSGTVFNSIKKFDFDETLGAKLYDLSTKAATDVFGRDSYNWYKGAKKIAGMYHEAPDAVYTASVKSGAMFSDLDLDKTTEATVIKNGVELKDTYQIKKGLNGSDYTTGTVLDAGNGVLVEAYVDEDMDVTLIVVDTYLAVVEDVLDDEVDFTVYMEDGSEVAVNNVETDMDLVEDDYVLVTMVKNEIQTIAVPETVNGELDAHGAKSTYTMMDEEKYNHSENLNQKDTVTYNPAYDVEMIMMLDEYGYMIGLVPVKSTEKMDGYVLLTDSEFEVGGLASNGKALVEVLHLDGTGYEVLELDTKRVKEGGVRVTKFLNELGDWEVLEETSAIEYGFYGYYMTEDGEIVLKALDTTKAADVQALAKNGGKIVADGKTQEFTFNGSSMDLVLDNDTVLNMVTADDVETYEGYKNIKIDETGVDILVVYNGRTVETIYVIDGNMLDNNIYAYYNGTEFRIIDKKLYLPMYVEGELNYYLYATKNSAGTWVPVVTVTGGSFTPDFDKLWEGVYKIELEGNELAKLQIVKDEWYRGTVTKSADKYFHFDDINTTTQEANWITYADGCNVYDLTDGGAKVDKVSRGDTVIYIVNSAADGNVATNVWILAHNSGTAVKPDSNEEVTFKLHAGALIINVKAETAPATVTVDALKDTATSGDVKLVLTEEDVAVAHRAEYDNATNKTFGYVFRPQADGAYVVKVTVGENTYTSGLYNLSK